MAAAFHRCAAVPGDHLWKKPFRQTSDVEASVAAGSVHTHIRSPTHSHVPIKSMTISIRTVREPKLVISKDCELMRGSVGAPNCLITPIKNLNRGDFSQGGREPLAVIDVPCLSLAILLGLYMLKAMGLA